MGLPTAECDAASSISLAAVTEEYDTVTTGSQPTPGDSHFDNMGSHETHEFDGLCRSHGEPVLSPDIDPVLWLPADIAPSVVDDIRLDLAREAAGQVR